MAEEVFTTEEALRELLEACEYDDGEEPGIEAPTFAGACGDESSVSESEGDAGQSLEKDELPQTTRRRNYATRSKRLVRCLTSALNPDNYKEVPAVNTVKMLTSFLEKPSPTAKSISWVNEKRTTAVGRQPRSSVILGRPGPTGSACSAIENLQSWELFFSRDMIQSIVQYTNKRIRCVRRDFSEISSSLHSFTKDTDEIEIRAFLGLQYLRGLAGLNNHDIAHLYHPTMGPPHFSATMSKNRLQFLYACVCFDDFTTREKRWKHDRFAAIRNLFETFNQNCSKCVIPEEFICIDETLYPTRNKISFRQYNPSKPAKYGLLFKSINSVTYTYTHCIIPYCGKPTEDATGFYVKGVEETVQYLVQNLQKYVDLQGRNITFDRYYTSVALAKWLLSHNITCVGTLQSNRRGIPSEIKDMSERELFSYEFFWESIENKLMLHSYVVSTKNSGKRNVLLLSTAPAYLGVTKDDGKKKPAIYKLYDFTKGGTDVMDRRIGTYTCKSKSNRWTLTAFSYILDVCRINASTVLALNKNVDPQSQDAYQFGIDLALSLIRPHIQRRSLVGLQMSIKNKMSLILGYEVDTYQNQLARTASMAGLEDDLHPKNREKSSRCKKCMSEIVGPQHRTRVQGMTRSRNQCQLCAVAACTEHSIQLCVQCYMSLKH